MEEYLSPTIQHQNILYQNQLRQVLLDLEVCHPNNEIVTSILSRWKFTAKDAIGINQGSSYFHTDVSKVLKGMGIQHRCVIYLFIYYIYLFIYYIYVYYIIFIYLFK
jgi:hypothetical protein